MEVYHRPDTLEEAIRLLANAPLTVAAGCTDLFPATTRQRLPGPVLDITGVAGLRRIEHLDAGWRIGANVTWADICRAELPPAFDMLKQAAREVGSTQIQNAGTVVGNICNASPAADGVPPLLALDAVVEVRGPDGVRQVPLGDFITGVRRTVLQRGEMVTAVRVPEAATLGQSRFVKLGARAYLVISIAMVAVRLVAREGRIAQAAVAVGACSAVAQRLDALEQVLIDAPWEPETAACVTPELVVSALAPISDIRADAAYREGAATELVRRALEHVLRGGGQA